MRHAFFALAAAAATVTMPTGAVGGIGLLANDVDELVPLDAHAQTSVAIVDRLRHYHFKSQPLDDAASSRIFDKYLRFLDPKRAHFLVSDIAELEQHRTALDEALETGDLEPAFEIYNLYRRRALDRIEYELALLQRGVEQFDFSLDESVQLDRENAPWPATREEAENLWRLGLKSRVLSGKLAGDPLETIGETLAKRIKNRLRLIRQTRSEDVFQTYVNAFAQTYDDHTQYFSPRDSEDFDIYMSLSLEGIGAVLELNDEYTTVSRLVKGGPADMGGVLKPADRIIAVSQSAKEPFVDVVGWRIDEVVQLIRGPKGSPVLLKVIPADEDAGTHRVVEIVRNTVSLEEQSASKSLLKLDHDGREYRIGIVVVPTFYLDFEALRARDPDYRSTTRDVARIIDELKGDGIDGLIVDLRNNGGGSLQEAVDLVGLFVESGPVVQVTNLRRSPQVFSDNDGKATWQGPLAVMVNYSSASASEIFAGAIQDYGLGVVVGSKTFGKGTVQTVIPLHRGDLKLTERRFYRVSGEGTERNGVVPDIAYPSPGSRAARRSQTVDHGVIDTPLGARGNQVPATEFRAPNLIEPLLDTLRGRHQMRADSDPEFAYLRAREDYIEKLTERTQLSLQEAARQAEKEADDAWLLETENALLLAKGEQPVASVKELNERREAEALEPPAPEEDTLVRETANVLVDLIGLSPALASADHAPRPAPAAGPLD